MQYSLSKIIIVLIVVVAVGGGFTLWYLSQSHPSTQTTIATPNGLPNVPQTTGNASSQTTTTAEQAAPPIDQAYASIFTKLSAQKVAFVSVDASTTGTAANIYSLYAKDVAISKELYPTTTDFPIEVAAVDLNGDGVAEALVYEDLPGFCGSGGCALDIYQDKQGKWVKISGFFGAGEVGVSSSLTGGYHDLFLSVSGFAGAQNGLVRYAWDGTQYQPKETVATWGSTGFTLSQ